MMSLNCHSEEGTMKSNSVALSGSGGKMRTKRSFSYISVLGIVCQNGLGVVQNARAVLCAACLLVKVIDLAGNLSLVGISIVAVQLGSLLILAEGILPVLLLLAVLGLFHGILEALLELHLLAGMDFHLLLALG